MEVIANFKTQEYAFNLVDEKGRTQKIKQSKTDKQYYLIVSDIDLVSEFSKVKTQKGELMDYAERLENALENSGVDIDEILEES